jgi:hypothetical protein
MTMNFPTMAEPALALATAPSSSSSSAFLATAAVLNETNESIKSIIHDADPNINQAENKKDDAFAKEAGKSNYSLIIVLFSIIVVLLGYLTCTERVNQKTAHMIQFARGLFAFSGLVLALFILAIAICARYVIGWIVFQMVLERCLPAQILVAKVPDVEASEVAENRLTPLKFSFTGTSTSSG